MSDQLQEVKKEKIFQEIVRQIHHLIKSGSLKAGDKLPPERDLARVFKVSRASVREAIRYLESSGLVRARVGDGTYVETDTVENIIEPLASIISGEKENLSEIFAIRKMVEPHLAFLAAAKASDTQIAELAEILQSQKGMVENGIKFTEIDYTFHLKIAVLSGSKVYLKLYTTLARMINQTREEFLQEGDRPHRSIEGHQFILHAFSSREPAKARLAMLTHLRTIEKEALKESTDIRAPASPP